MLAGGLAPAGCTAIVPMIDARRMEVYSAVYSPAGERLSEIAPVVVDSDSFADLEGTVLFAGDGALKCCEVLGRPGFVFEEVVADAASMAPLAFRKLEERDFADTAYFEPFYLKDFVATVSRKKLW